MPEIFKKNGVEFLPSSKVAKVLGYGSDYVSKLARDEKILGTQVGRRWYINLESAVAFKEEVEKDKLRQAEAIREERLREQKQYQKLNPPELRQVVSRRHPSHTKVLVALVLSLLLVLGFTTFSAPPSSQVSQAQAQDEQNVFERIAVMLYRFLTPEKNTTEVRVVEVPSTQQQMADIRIVDPNSSSATTTFTTLIVAPDELFTETQVAEVRESFSDEVEISVDPNNPDTGIITPVFRDRRGDDYRYLMMPVPKPNES